MDETPEDDPYRVTQKTVDRLLKAAGVVESLGVHVGAIRGAHAPAVGTLWEQDSTVPLSQHIRNQATIAVSVAFDHLRAWSLIIETGNIPVYAPMTLVRAAIETSALSRWLVDPSISSIERAARGVSAQLDDFDQRRKFETAIGAPEPDAKGTAQSGAQRFAELARHRDDAGIPRLQFPGPTAIVAKYPELPNAPGPWPYRLASAFSHGKMWSFLGMNLKPALAARDAGESAPITSDETVLAGMTDIAIRATAHAVKDIEAYLGISAASIGE